MLWLVTFLAAAGLPPDLPRPCGTPTEWAPVVNPVLPDLPPPPGDLGLRDAYGVEAVEVSDHFALRWGPLNPPSAEERANLLEAFELAWDVEIEGMEHTAPFGTDAYHFNVYVGDTDGGTPSSNGAAGYYTTDRDGWPIIVVARNGLEDPDRVRVTAAHEFYHAIQGATRRYNYDPAGPSAWLWEATATAVAREVYPDNTGYADFLFGYAYHPHLRLDFFDYPDSGAVTEFYQYGAFVFAVHVADRMGSWRVLRDVWEDPGDDGDPLAVLARLLDEEGVELGEMWMDHIARNAVWDYPDGQVYAYNVRQYDALPEARNNDPIQLPIRGRDGWTDGPSGLRPGRFGSNRFVLIRPVEGSYTIEVEADEFGDLGGSTRLGATVVLDVADQDPEYRPLSCTGLRCEGTWDDLDRSRNTYLVVGTWTEERESGWFSDSFRYRWQVSYTAPPAEVYEPQPRSCGCTGTPSAGVMGLWAGLFLLPLWRRRR